MPKVRKKVIDGVMREGKYIHIRKNTRYEGIDGCQYIPRSSMYSKGDGYKIAIFDKLELTGDRWILHQIVMNGEEFKKVLGLKEEGKVTIDG